MVGRWMTWSSRNGRTAVPIAKNSVVCEPQVWLCWRSCTPTMPSAWYASASACIRLMASSLASYSAWVNCSISTLRPMLPSTPPSRWCAMWYTHVPITMPSGAYPARISVQKSWPVRSEVKGWFLLLRQLLTPPRPDPGRPQRVCLRLHPGHGQLSGVVHRLRQHVEFLVAPPPAELKPDVVDRAAEHQP